MLEETLSNVRLTMRYPDEDNDERTRSFTFRHLALDAGDDRILDLSDAFKSLMYDPAMDTVNIKNVAIDLHMSA